MAMMWRRLTIRVMTPIVWNLSRKRAAQAFQKFSATEADSGWQFLYALEATEDAALRAELFKNAMEEMYHASEFEKLSNLCTNALLSKPKPERKPIYDPRKPYAAFLSYVYVGEKDVYDQFDAYSAALKKAVFGEGLSHSVFEEAKEDEDGHLNLAKTELMKEYGSKRAATVEITKIRLKRAYEAWLRFSKRIGEFSSTIILSCLYFVFGSFFVFPCRKLYSSEPTTHEPGVPAESGATGKKRVMAHATKV